MGHSHHTPRNAFGQAPYHSGGRSGKMMANGLPVAARARKEVIWQLP